MGRSLVVILAVAALFLSTGATTPRATTVELTPVDGGLQAAYRLPAPTSAFTFDEPVADVRADAWHPAADFVLADGVLRRRDGKTFSVFTVTLTPDSEPRDRRYPALTRIGIGWQIYGPYFKPATGDVTVQAILPKGWVSVGVRRTGGLSTEGYAYVGPAAYVTRGPATLVMAPETPAWLRTGIAESARFATRYYGQRLDTSLTDRPTLIVTPIPTFKAGWQGDTTDGPVASLRFFGTGWVDAGPGKAGEVTHFVTHEFFHFWNTRLFVSRDGENEAWLHEGMAEYAALRASLKDGAISEDDFRAALSQRLSACAMVLGDRGLAAAPPKRGHGVYDCGVLIEWVADLKAQATSVGQRDVFDVWRGVFKVSKAGPGTYDGAALLAAVGMTDAAEDPFALVMKPGGPDRWPRLVAALSELGVRLTPTRDAAQEREILVMHLMRQVCNGSIGFWNNSGRPAIKLDSGDHCGVLSGEPQVDAIAGFNVVEATSAAYDAVTALCAKGAMVPFTFEGQMVAQVPCKKALPPPPPAWTVVGWTLSRSYLPASPDARPDPQRSAG